jgi:hypothetical protein
MKWLRRSDPVGKNSSPWLWLPPALACLADATVTLVCQDPDYWQGRYELALEGNPLARLFLAYHPLAFGVLVVTYIAGIVWVVGWWPRPLAVSAAVLLTLSHSCGVACWCVGMLGSGVAGWGTAVMVLVAAERVLHSVWRPLELNTTLQ